MSMIYQPLGTELAGTVLYVLLSSNFSAITTSVGRTRFTLCSAAFFVRSRTKSSLSSSTRDAPISYPWDLKKVLEEVAREEDVVRLKHSLADKSAAEILEVKIEAGKLVKESLDRRRESYCHRTVQFLGEVALDSQPNMMLNDEMVMNMAFLVRKESQDDFDSQVRRIDEVFDDHISFRVIGPLPPYTFSTVEIRCPHPGQIGEAKRLFGLGNAVSDEELRETYRRLAGNSHPDACLEDKGDNKGFIKVREAFVLLRDYCQGQSVGENAKGQCYSLKPEDISQAFLVNIKRPALSAGGLN